MEVLTYAEFNEWLNHFGHSLSEIIERWEDRLLIGDNGISLIQDDYYDEWQKWLH